MEQTYLKRARDLQISGILGFEDMDPSPIGVFVKERQELSTGVIETWVIQFGPDQGEAYFAYPKGPGPWPLVLISHSHGGDFAHGKSEIIQSPKYLQAYPWLNQLLDLGYCVACMDQIGFESRTSLAETELVKRQVLLGQPLWGRRLWESCMFLDACLERRQVDRRKVVAMGMSMGAMASWWLGLLHPKVNQVVDIAGLVPIEYLFEHGSLDRHGFYYYLPNFLKKTSTAKLQAALLAKVKRLSLVGQSDRLCPRPGVEELLQETSKLWGRSWSDNQWQICLLEGGHEETEEMRLKWIEFLKPAPEFSGMEVR